MELCEVYDEIAEDWSNKHQRPFPPEILNVSDWKGRILDLGCGNCVNLTMFRDSELYGIDFSKSMINQAKIFCEKRGLNVKLQIADLRKIPFEDKFFDYVIFSASLHHLKKEEHIKVLKEVRRVLRGKCFLSVWNKNHKDNLNKDKEIMKPWTYKGITYERYYYLFDENELLDVVKKSGFKVERNFTKPGSQNICLVIS